MNKLQLEHGKQYVNRKGEVVTVFRFSRGLYELYPFTDNGRKTYTTNGQWQHWGTSDDDLVAEYSPKKHVEWKYCVDETIYKSHYQYKVDRQLSDVPSGELYYLLYNNDTGCTTLRTKQDVETNFVKVDNIK